MRKLWLVLLATVLTMGSWGCRDNSKQAPQKTTTVEKKTSDKSGKATGETKKIDLKFGKGVDAAKKEIRIATLNDETGPAAAIGKSFAIGKRLLVDEVNAGSSPYIPKGWKLVLVEEDHSYNPQKSVQAYKKVAPEILFVAHSFGTPTTLPLRKDLEKDGMVAFPASLSSKMAEHKHTPPIGTAYNIEAMRAMDFAVKKLGGADKVKAGIVYQQDDYGTDGLNGWKKAAKKHGVTIVAEQTVAPGQKDMAGVVLALKKAGANVVLLTVLPSATGPILGTAAKLQYGPTWIGNTPAWLDVFFSPKVIPPVVFGNFYWMNSVPFWGEKVPGMDRFLKAWGTWSAKNKGVRPDFYILTSYIQGLTMLEAVKRSIEAGDITRAGFLKALNGIKDFTAGGMIQAMNLSKTPYVTGTRTRVLKPVMAKGTWTVAADYAVPQAL